MDLVFLKLVALLRPLASMQQAEKLFDVLGIGLFGLAVGAMLVSIALRRALHLSAIDWFIVTFTTWCLAIYVIYFETARIAEVAKLVVPMLTYTLAKNVIPDERQYWRLVSWMIVGFCIPVAASVVSIATGDLKAVQYVSYWTALPRWQGAYVNSHNLGHSMSLLLMILALYTHRGTVEREKDAKGSRAFEVSLIALLAVAALYCLYQSQVRTALLGLAVFGAIFLYHENRRLLLILGTSLLVIALATATYWIPALIPEVSMVQRGIEIDALDLGSGRGRFWLNDILVYGELPIDQQLAGVGIGARGQSLDGGEMLYGHSDWLEILTQTGLIGLSLFSVLQILILRAILKMRGGQRFGFLAMFLAVNFMMASSNSYAWRIQVSQLYYMLLAFIELRNVQDRRENDGSQERSRELELDGPHRSASRSPVAPVSFNLQTTDMRLRSADGGSKRCLA